MTRHHIDRLPAFLIALVFLALPAAARAQNTLSIGDFTITPGATSLTIPINFTSTAELTAFAFELAFTPAQMLCGALADPAAIAIQSVGRTAADPEEDVILCEEGVVRIAVFDLRGRTVVPSGEGEVFQVNLGSVASGAAGTVAFSIRSIIANAGATPITVATPNGEDSPVVKTFGEVVTTTTATTSTTLASTTSTTTTSTTTTTASTSTSTTVPTTTSTTVPTTSTSTTVPTTTTTTTEPGTTTTTTEPGTTTTTTEPATTTTTTEPATTTTTTIPAAVCGNSQVEGDEDCDPPGATTCPPALPGGDDTDCEDDCTCPGNTDLSEDATAGATVIEVDDETGFDVGDAIRINPGGANQEDNTVTGFGSSLVLQNPLAFDHEADEMVVELPGGLPTTTTTETTSTSTTSTPVTTTTTTTVGGGMCGNGVVDPGEECDPPWSRKSDQCPPLPGHKFGPECGDDCRCVTTSTSSTTTTTEGGTTSTSTTTTEASTTTTSSTTTTTVPERQDIQCCITRSPDGAFPATTCEFLKPTECTDSGGIDMGPGACDPNPCVSTTTTTLPGPSALGCVRDATMSSVECRLAKLIGMVNEAGEMQGLRGKLLALLHKAEARMHRAEQLRSAGKNRQSRNLLRRAARDLRVFRDRLRSRRARRLLPQGERDVMLGLAEPLRADIQTLVASAGR